MYATSSRLRSLSNTMSPRSCEEISVQDRLRSSRSRLSAISLMDSGSIGRLAQAVYKPRKSFSLLKTSEVLFDFRTIKGFSPNRSYVVNRSPQDRHSRRLLIEVESSDGLESTTLDSEQEQAGQRIWVPPNRMMWRLPDKITTEYAASNEL